MDAHPLENLMTDAMDKIRSMVDSNTVVGEPITTPEGVMLIPVSRISFGFASGGNDRHADTKNGGVWAGSGAAVRIDPIGFLKIQEDSARLIAVQMPAFSTMDRVIDLIPDVLDRVESMTEKLRGGQSDTY